MVVRDYPPLVKAWAGVVEDPFPGRVKKPRRCGLTMVIDKGLSLLETEGLLDLAGEYIDFIKLAFGTSALYSRSLLIRKIDLIRSYDIGVYPGGTFLEIALLQDRLERFISRAVELGFTGLEVSDGTISLGPDDRERAVKLGAEAGLTVVTEVGKKDADAKPALTHLRDQIGFDLTCGASHVIVEGRESGKGVGVYDAGGAVVTVDVDELIADLADPSVLIWETPLKNQQESMTARFGANVNLGNIAPQEVMALEALRRGLRGDTLRLYLEQSNYLPSTTRV